jgi:hypothetical protein
LLKEQELLFLTEAIKDLTSKIEKMQKASWIKSALNAKKHFTVQA